MKKIIRDFLRCLERVFGIVVLLQIKKNKKSEYGLIDKNMFSAFLNKDAEVDLYEKGMIKSNSSFSDNFYKRCRYYSLVQTAAHASQISNSLDIVECGVWKGHSAWMIAKIFQKNDFQGKFYIFDSFDGGLSDKGINDNSLIREMTQSETKFEKEYFSSQQSDVVESLSEYDFVEIYPGWIPEKFEKVSDKKFSFVHIDVDLYDPTLMSLNFFWPRLVQGGYLVVDDYGSSQFPGATSAVNNFLDLVKPSYFYKVPMGSCILRK